MSGGWREGDIRCPVIAGVADMAVCPSCLWHVFCHGKGRVDACVHQSVSPFVSCLSCLCIIRCHYTYMTRGKKDPIPPRRRDGCSSFPWGSVGLWHVLCLLPCNRKVIAAEWLQVLAASCV